MGTVLKYFSNADVEPDKENCWMAEDSGNGRQTACKPTTNQVMEWNGTGALALNAPELVKALK